MKIDVYTLCFYNNKVMRMCDDSICNHWCNSKTAENKRNDFGLDSGPIGVCKEYDDFKRIQFVEIDEMVFNKIIEYKLTGGN